MRYSSSVLCSIVPGSQASEAGEMKGGFMSAFGIEDNAKFSISSVLKISVVFSSKRRHLYLQHSGTI